MDWMRRQDIKEESAETPAVLTPEDADECYFEEDTSIDEGMAASLVLTFLPQLFFLLGLGSRNLENNIVTSCVAPLSQAFPVRVFMITVSADTDSRQNFCDGKRSDEAAERWCKNLENSAWANGYYCLAPDWRDPHAKNAFQPRCFRANKRLDEIKEFITDCIKSQEVPWPRGMPFITKSEGPRGHENERFDRRSPLGPHRSRHKENPKDFLAN
uniref:Uncharacterized protein n=1 Tax=Vespula pensylvanica TaxID=30213 RepID=A0A834JST2_VESPE|nr:hypothetical protein H0235_016778 [Vespula pensylvanica]